ncbi:hypothetical protein P3T40_007061 [Paraburkholderia sp. EB58]|jgi:hypothetical protein|uniref:hypothetical protein n=1 Tax=Paraburkholderia sp. EB58 TaxID=3035125 RepID=UPI003D20B7DA
MATILEIQLTLNNVVYPASFKALGRIGSPRHRADHIKSILESHFRALEEAQSRPGGDHLQQSTHLATSRNRPVGYEAPAAEPAVELENTFASYFK